jgi:2-amino-4-hydroxy-6-hydroxymethyldihydropteridine diphosphokinase
MQNEKRVFLLTGSNIEPRAKYLALADKEIEANVGKIICRSSIYESEPWGFKAETPFLNQVLVLITELTPFEILIKIHILENQLGRLRKGKAYVSRTIDVDILYVDDEIIQTEELKIPHPRLHERKFTLLPLAEIAGGFMHPILKNTNNELLQKVNDQSRVQKVEVNKNWESV